MSRSGQQIGVLGGGQLGAFFTIAAKRFGYFVTVWDPDPNAPAHAWADETIAKGFDDPEGLHAFVKACAAATYEWENVPVGLVEAIEAKMPVRPDNRVLRLLQNRAVEKDFLKDHGFPLTPYRLVRNAAELQTAAEALGFPLVCKTATAGYDGQGQWTLKRPEEIALLAPRLRDCSEGWIVEQFVPYVMEISIVSVRDAGGRIVTYPVAENRHEAGILRQTNVPADIDTLLEKRVSSLSKEVLTALDGIGVFCIEFFLLKDNGLLINEIAPRPHNSGHYSLDACTISQFEQQVRVVGGLPIEAPRLLSPAVMVNVLGHEIQALNRKRHLAALMRIAGSRVYHYRKKNIKARRKMGHITFVQADREQASARAASARTILDGVAGTPKTGTEQSATESIR
ncbi:MAG: 5-(carboxyamino)imidazole ribonucleotide synthase [Nitrospiria bacterium]